MPTAAVVIIGNEILSGKFADENGPYLIGRLRALGCDLKRLVVVADEYEAIADAVRRASDDYDFVITTGGVGPTHDDITLQSIGQAFGLPLHVHPDLLALLEKFGLPNNDATLRMVTIPEGADLVWEAGISYPVLVVRNVYVFPGVPKLMQNKFESTAHRFAGEAVQTARVYTNQRETEIAAILGEVQDRYPSVDIGSYPRWGEGNYKVIVTLESRESAALRGAHQEINERLSVVEPER